MLDAARMEKETRRGTAPQLRSFHNHVRRNASDLRSMLRRVLANGFGDGIESRSMLRDELVIDLATLDHDVHHAVENPNIATWPHGNKQIRIAGNRSHAGINDDELRTVFASLPEIVGCDGRAFRNICSSDQDHLCFGNIAPRIRTAVD